MYKINYCFEYQHMKTQNVTPGQKLCVLPFYIQSLGNLIPGKDFLLKFLSCMNYFLPKKWDDSTGYFPQFSKQLHLIQPGDVFKNADI